ncbi:MAG: VTT domain-containing protein, partial [Cellvibrionaceae bacterium]|nr:VTT domain-containing protein [Cellvibrionaceae bacterium]
MQSRSAQSQQTSMRAPPNLLTSCFGCVEDTENTNTGLDGFTTPPPSNRPNNVQQLNLSAAVRSALQTDITTATRAPVTLMPAELAKSNTVLAERIRSYAILCYAKKSELINRKRETLRLTLNDLRHKVNEALTNHRNTVTREEKFFYGVKMRNLMKVAAIYIPSMLLGAVVSTAFIGATGGTAIAGIFVGALFGYLVNRVCMWPVRKAMLEPAAGEAAKQEIKRMGHKPVFTQPDVDKLINEFF